MIIEDYMETCASIKCRYTIYREERAQDIGGKLASILGAHVGIGQTEDSRCQNGQ
jgi:hypothetical protein